MGGCRSRTRDQGSYESNTYYEAEKLLGFHRHTPDAIDYAFRKVVNGPSISPTAWSWLLNTCGISNHDLFQAFHSEGRYDANKLYVFGILTSNGELDTKLELIFEFWDKERVGTIDKAVVADITKTMGEVASQHVDVIIPTSKLSSDRKLTYQNDLNKRRDQWKDEKTEKIGSTMSKAAFLEHFNFIETTKDVRTEIEKVKLKPAKFIAAFDVFAKSVLK